MKSIDSRTTNRITSNDYVLQLELENVDHKMECMSEKMADGQSFCTVQTFSEQIRWGGGVYSVNEKMWVVFENVI